MKLCFVFLNGNGDTGTGVIRGKVLGMIIDQARDELSTDFYLGLLKSKTIA